MISKNLLISDIRNTFSRRYTLEEYLEMTRTREAKKHLRSNKEAAELIAKKIMADPRAKKCFAVLTGTFLYLQKFTVAAADPKTADAISKINSAGSMLFGVIRTIGFWICLLMCVVEILKCLANGDTKEITRIIFKYLMAFAAFFIVPWLFDLIRAVFG